MQLPIRLEGILYSNKEGEYQFLILKRAPSEGGFWQPLTGTLEEGEDLADCLLRELFEETGIKSPISITEEVWRFTWKKGAEVIDEIVFGIELKGDEIINLNPREHTEYKWVSFEEAMKLLGKDNNKKSFREFATKVASF